MFKSAIAAIAAIMLAAPAPAATIGSIAGDTAYLTYYLDNGRFSQLRGALTGAGHAIKAGTATVTASYLSDVDVFYTGLISHSASGQAMASEISALQAWVSGGGTLIIGGDNSGFYTNVNSWLNPFGLSQAGTSTNGGMFATGSHALLANGVAGSAVGVVVGGSFAAGSYDTLASQGSAPVIVGKTYGSGYVIGLADTNFHDDPLTTQVGQFFVNTMDYNSFAPVPLPATLPLLAFGLGALGFGLRRRQRAEQ